MSEETFKEHTYVDGVHYLDLCAKCQEDMETIRRRDAEQKQTG